MSERMRESLSALMDDEANELELERILARIGEDDALRRSWMRFHAARGALAGQGVAHFELDVSHAIRAAIARPVPGFAQRLRRPLAGFAVAASVAATAVIGGQQLGQLGGVAGTDDTATLATRPSPVGMLNSLGAMPVHASYGTQAVPAPHPATNTAYQELARQRMERYMQDHAEQAALNSPQGLVLYARVPQIHD